MIQSENWRGARDPARELEGAGDAGNSSIIYLINKYIFKVNENIICYYKSKYSI